MTASHTPGKSISGFDSADCDFGEGEAGRSHGSCRAGERNLSDQEETANPRPEAVTKAWLNGLLERRLDDMLATVGQNPSQLVAEFVKLVALDRKWNPPEKKVPVIIWEDWLGPDDGPSET